MAQPSSSTSVPPRSPSVDSPFWDALAANELRISRCVRCREWKWPPQWRCGSCGGWDLAWEQVPLTGIVYSFARNWHPFGAQMQGKTPFVSLLVELPDAGGARLLGLLVGEERGLEMGAALDGIIEPPEVPGGRHALRWRLRAASLAP
jgi:uncharacterized OB-fold protein